MFSKTFKITHSIMNVALMLMLVLGLSACDSAKPPELMKAVKQFDSDEIRDAHVKNMRKNHMDELLHKRDETVKKGIRTEEHSLKACISCHVPEKYNGEVLRHTNPKHFCSTCHGYVAQQLDCFQCHVDHPVSENSMSQIPTDSIHSNVVVSQSSKPDSISINSSVKTGESTSE